MTSHRSGGVHLDRLVGETNDDELKKRKRKDEGGGFSFWSQLDRGYD